MNAARAILKTAGRTLLLLALVMIGTITLIRLAPGYFVDVREMDVKYGNSVRSQLQETSDQRSTNAVALSQLQGWLHGDLGQSRQYEIPVWDLLRPRLGITASLLVRGIAYGWLVALGAALPLSLLRRGTAFLSAPFTIALAVPTAAMATLCLLAGIGGPVLVLTLLLAARDFKFLFRMFREVWKAPHVLHARAQGLGLGQLLRSHVFAEIGPRLASLATLSLITALSSIVPIEVIFNVPGVGQLAWMAAMNRDLPVLLTVTLLMAVAVVVAGAISQPIRKLETA